MSAHETSYRQCPGWWPSLLEAVCSCGWAGPTRDANRLTGSQIRARLEKDGDEHRREMEAA